MQEFSPGQRWISDTEPDLGLGTILDEDARQLTIVFMASGETRIYAKETAPLTRISFSSGDTVKTHDERDFRVASSREEDGVLHYTGHYLQLDAEETSEAEAVDSTSKDLVEISEADLSNFLKFSFPQDRLFAGQIDNRRWFNLRSDVFRYRFDMDRSIVRGLLGSRIALIPHQLYIASEVSRRLAPRVLLADEVGLGKTIEAGMILHSQIVNHQVSRVLIVVPESLLHQWLVEMLRRFNLKFSIIDEELYKERLPSAPDENPFLGEQLCLCSLDCLLANPDMQTTVVQGQWDMLIVDEAHHLQWSPDQPSEAYTLIESIAQQTASVLLLTATPEQLGQHSHFARLRLLDPDRFGNYSEFASEESRFGETAELANALLSDSALEATQIERFHDLVDTPLSESEQAILGAAAATDLIGLRERLLNVLIDRHGTGRVLFRNTRSSIEGFPERHLHHHSMETSDTASDYATWLGDFLGSVYPDKVLAICAKSKTVQDLGEKLRIAGINSAQFHEGMTIIERDRAAAWFADDEESCQILICSEIGSEGRNFQFLHNLVMFELPPAPDLLEQRIGRLDRIGQEQDIQIHVPCSNSSRDERLMRWYHEGLNAFESICKVGSAIAVEVQDQLQQVLDSEPLDQAALEQLINTSQELAAQYNQQLEQGRDQLLELNSNRTERIAEHLDELNRENRNFRLPDFMSRVFDCFGVESEEQTNGSWIIQPGDHMQTANFPLLPQDGLTITFDRRLALEREDFTFLSWDHPMVIAAMDLVLSEGFGQANAAVIDTSLLPKGVMYLEVLLTWTCSADKSLNINRYFPAAINRFMLGSNRKDYTGVLEQLDLEGSIKRFDKVKVRRFIQQNRPDLEVLLNYTNTLARNQLQPIVDQASEKIEQELNPEIERLETLQKINPTVRQDEITALKNRKTDLLQALENTRHEIVAISVLINL